MVIVIVSLVTVVVDLAIAVVAVIISALIAWQQGKKIEVNKADEADRYDV